MTPPLTLFKQLISRKKTSFGWGGPHFPFLPRSGPKTNPVWGGGTRGAVLHPTQYDQFMRFHSRLNAGLGGVKLRRLFTSEPEHDQYGSEIIDMSGPVEPEGPGSQPAQETAKQSRWAKTVSPEEVKSFVDDVIAGRGRDSPNHEQFMANYNAEIEEEFQRRFADVQEARHEPPPLEPDSYVPIDREPAPPEPDLDWEMGD